MKKIDRILKPFKEEIQKNYIDIDNINRKIKALEAERFKLMNQKIDSAYEDYSKDFQINIINIQLDILYQILEEQN